MYWRAADISLPIQHAPVDKSMFSIVTFIVPNGTPRKRDSDKLMTRVIWISGFAYDLDDLRVPSVVFQPAEKFILKHRIFI